VSDIEVMIAYLLLKVKQKDWHGVADAAMDIREMEARENTEPFNIDAISSFVPKKRKKNNA
jgi:hypothetical protein